MWRFQQSAIYFKGYVEISTIVEFSGKELEIIRLIVEGKDNKEIASCMHFSEGNIKNTISRILDKLQLQDRTQLAVYALKNNLV